MSKNPVNTFDNKNIIVEKVKDIKKEVIIVK